MALIRWPQIWPKTCDCISAFWLWYNKRIILYFGPRPLRSSVTSVPGQSLQSWDRSVHPIQSLVISVLDHFRPKDRTDLATSVLSKPKLSQCICKVSLRCMFIIVRKSAICCIWYIIQKSNSHFITKKETPKNILKTLGLDQYRAGTLYPIPIPGCTNFFCTENAILSGV